MMRFFMEGSLFPLVVFRAHGTGRIVDERTSSSWNRACPSGPLDTISPVSFGRGA